LFSTWPPLRPLGRRSLSPGPHVTTKSVSRERQLVHRNRGTSPRLALTRSSRSWFPWRRHALHHTSSRSQCAVVRGVGRVSDMADMCDGLGRSAIRGWLGRGSRAAAGNLTPASGMSVHPACLGSVGNASPRIGKPAGILAREPGLSIVSGRTEDTVISLLIGVSLLFLSVVLAAAIDPLPRPSRMDVDD
jgi:hypothetical protein